MRSYTLVRALALVLGLMAATGLTACGGSSGGVPGADDSGIDDGGVDDGGMFFTADPLTTDWQLLYGADSNGIGEDKEGVVALENDGMGGTFFATDRRFASDPNRRRVVFGSVSAAGALTSASELLFASNVTPYLMRRDPAGNFVLALDDIELIKMDAAGTLIWAKTLTRAPFAFGGLDIFDMQFDAAGNVYIAGGFNPSEPGDEMGFVAKLDASGNGQWMRAWTHSSFFERVRLAVTNAGSVFVVDRIPGGSEIDRPIVVLGFDTNGTSTGQTALPTGSSPLAINSAGIIANGDGASVIGTSGIARDGVLKTYLAQFDLDASLNLVAAKGTQFDSSTLLIGPIRPIRTPAGALRFAVRTDNDYHVCEFSPSAAIAKIYHVVRSPGNTTPVIDDQDYELLLGSGPNEEWILAASSDEPGAVVLAPVIAESLAVSIPLSDSQVTITANTLVVTDGATTYTVSADSAGEVNMPEANEDDALIVSASEN